MSRAAGRLPEDSPVFRQTPLCEAEKAECLRRIAGGASIAQIVQLTRRSQAEVEQLFAECVDD